MSAFSFRRQCPNQSIRLYIIIPMLRRRRPLCNCPFVPSVHRSNVNREPETFIIFYIVFSPSFNFYYYRHNIKYYTHNIYYINSNIQSMIYTDFLGTTRKRACEYVHRPSKNSVCVSYITIVFSKNDKLKRLDHIIA